MTQYLAIPENSLNLETLGLYVAPWDIGHGEEIRREYFSNYGIEKLGLIRTMDDEIDPAFLDYCCAKDFGRPLQQEPLLLLLEELFRTLKLPFVCWYGSDWNDLPNVTTWEELERALEDGCSNPSREFYFFARPSPGKAP